MTDVRIKRWYMAVCPIEENQEQLWAEQLLGVGFPAGEIGRIMAMSNASARVQSLAARRALLGAFCLRYGGGGGERPCASGEWPSCGESVQRRLADILGSWQITQEGKPECPIGGLDFSLTHTGQTAIAVLAGFPGMRIGVDAESGTRTIVSWERLAARFYSPEERKMCRTAGDFLTVWLRKEALGKARGTGLIGMLSDAHDQGQRYAENSMAGMEKKEEAPDYISGILEEGTRYTVCILEGRRE